MKKQCKSKYEKAMQRKAEYEKAMQSNIKALPKKIMGNIKGMKSKVCKKVNSYE